MDLTNAFLDSRRSPTLRYFLRTGAGYQATWRQQRKLWRSESTGGRLRLTGLYVLGLTVKLLQGLLEDPNI
jgi:hypothetical protein